MLAERQTHPRRVWFVVLVIVACALALGVWTISNWGAPSWLDVSYFVAGATAAELLGRVKVPLAGLALVDDEKPTVWLAPGFIVLVTAAYATRPSTALAVGVLVEIPDFAIGLARLLEGSDDRRDPLKRLFNAAQQAVYVGVASVAFWAVRGAVDSSLGAFAGACIAALLAVSLNHALVGVVVTVERHVPIRDVLQRMAWPAPLSLAYGVMALLIATLYVEFGVVAALFLFMPLMALRVVREAKTSLDAALERTIVDFARAVDEKDPYTYRHSDRVASITVALHRELGTRRKDLDRRWSGAVLHDIGKVGVPIGVLTKPGRLSEDEFETIKRHPVLGAEVVEEIDLFRSLAAEIRHHHERIDGAGYPDGLSGEEIPFAARVLAVADAFDALTSDRPYRRALSTSEAMLELERSAGSQHDCRIVSALARVLERGVVFVKPERTEATSRRAAHLRVVESA